MVTKRKPNAILALFQLLLLIVLVIKVLILITEVLLTVYIRSPIINTQALEAKHTRSKQGYS